MVRTNRFISAPRQRMQMIRRFGRRMSVWTTRRQLLAAVYWSWRPARCSRLILEQRRHRREWGRRHRMWDLRQWRHYIFSDESRFSLYHSDGRVRVRRRQEEKLIDASVQPNNGNRGPSVMVWGAIHHGGRSELVVVDGAMNRHWYIQILRNQMLPWATGLFGRNFSYVQDNASPHTARDMAAFLDQQDVEVIDWPARSHEPNWACLGSNVSLDPRHGWPPFHRSWTKQCCPPGVGCSSARKGVDPGLEHAPSCQVSSGR